MKKILIGVALAAAVLSTLPGNARMRTVSTKSVTFKAVTPCAVACSYWVNPNDPTLTATSYVDYAASVFEDDRGFNKQTSYACTDPGPAGSYRDIVLTAPRYSDHIKVVATPEVDWDIVLCSKPTRGNNGKLLAFEEQDGIDYDFPENSCFVGCKDTIMAKVTAGRKYVLRAYSWADPADLVARVYWQDW